MSVNNGGGASFTNKGAWSGLDAYSPGNVVTNSDVAYVCYQSIAAPTAAPALDGSATQENSVNTSSIAIALTTTQADDHIAILVFIQQQSAITVSSVADTEELTWTKRWAETGTNIDVELWTAPVEGVYNGTITATFSGATGGNSSASAVAFGVANCAGFDTNGGLPVHNTGTTALSVSTTDSPDLVLYVSTNSEGSVPTFPSGFTSMAEFSNNHGLQNNIVLVGYQNISTTWSAETVTPAGGSSANLNIVDAFTSEGLSNPAPGDDPSHWIG